MKIDLRDYGVRVFWFVLYNHAPLWFASSDVSRRPTTIPLLHNFALTYALGRRNWALSIGETPYYAIDPEGEFGAINLYCTPAEPLAPVKVRQETHNALDDRTGTTETTISTVAMPSLWHAGVIAPQYEDPETENPQRGFRGVAFLYENDEALPGIVHFGKKRGACRIWRREVEHPIAHLNTAPSAITHPVNPLDLSGAVVRCTPVTMPPTPVLRNCVIQNDWVIDDGQGRAIHVPRRVLQRIGMMEAA